MKEALDVSRVVLSLGDEELRRYGDLLRGPHNFEEALFAGKEE